MLTRNAIGYAGAVIVIVARLLAVPSNAQVSDDKTVKTEIATTVAEALAQNAEDHEHEDD